MTTVGLVLFVGSVALIAYVFAGYPVILRIAVALRPAKVAVPPVSGQLPRVSLVVAAYNEERYIERKLANCAELDFPAGQLQVIVAADGSTDGTEEIARRSSAALVLHSQKRMGKTAALVAAARSADGEILVFTDADNLYEPQTLRELVAPFADPRVGVVTGRKVIDESSSEAHQRSEGLYWRYESKLKTWESALGSVTGVCGEALAVRREALVEPPAGTVNDDFALAIGAALAGWRVVYAPRAVSIEPGAASADDEVTRRSRIVAGRWQALAYFVPRLLVHRPLLAWQLISHKALRPLVPFALGLALAGNLLLLPAGAWVWVLLGAQVTFYGAAAKGAWDARQGRRRLVWYLPYYFCRVNGAAVRGLFSWLGSRRAGTDLSHWKRARRAGE